MTQEKITLAEKFEQFDEHWTPHIVAELNGQHVKVAKFLGEFEWHHHEDEDELFFVIEGLIRIEFRDDTLVLEPGEMIVVPRGVEHKPVAPEEAKVLLFEPASTVNTGETESKRTVEELDRV